MLLTGLAKYDGVRTRHLKAREFHQIAGRAGRAGYDTMGTVVVQAPEHEVENLRAVAKAGDDPKKIKKIQRKKAPEGFVSWSEATFDRLVAASPEPLVSRFSVSNSMLLNVIARPGNCFDAMRHLLEDNHESRPAQRKHILKAISLYRGLLSAGIVERLDEPDEYGRMARLTMDLQRDFALNQPLSPFALAAFELLDVESDSYALDVVSIIESTLDDPRQVLMAQQHFARGEAVAQMKADGIEYEERMELLEEVTWPKPLSDLLFPAFEMYRGGHPWITEFALSPKSVVRDMIERAMTFAELISHYGLTRSEGLVLRYLADAYRALRQTVPTEARTEELEDIIEWLGELIRQVDSSLLDEWESLTDPEPRQTRKRLRSAPTLPVPSRRTRAHSASWCAMRCSDASISRRVDSGTSWKTSRTVSRPPSGKSNYCRTSRSTQPSEPGRRRAVRRYSRSLRTESSGGCGRCSRIRRAITDGRCLPSSTSRNRMPRVKSCSTN